jgi:hypothetical protein
MNTEFERTRVDIGGVGITITSWYEANKRRFCANAPAYLHLFSNGELEDGSNTATTRAGAIQAIRNHLARRLPHQESFRR